ncbi:pyridoxamine 5'-phosphate oxidase family protein [Haloprofundus sp. MHR1]|uniref:pyridoxamine 5'-phosphate oxidase family protein n=1 Tax=Haloprofundus sp. MHR1 TaxID=2572921 RepID=UPI0010BED534|nr:pyridoxamine 5'-phosphate oxidase family protein [Haloprofundus sp. MHR1]QCJ45945.1 pyridoxamine 5'-phosphate oxidase family protein [Haloprofundus sp. MHR1]
MHHLEYIYTVGMDRAEVEAALEQRTDGVLSLARDSEAYAIPVAYYFDGDALYFRLGRHDESDKLAFADETAEACFVLYDAPSPDESWSVIVRGPFTRLSADDRPDDAEINEAYTSLRVFGETVEDIDPVFYRLDIESVTGRRTS